LVIPDAHAHPDHHNERATWLSGLIHDLKPDVIINLGDGADMPSLCSYDKGKKSFQGRTYRKDVSSFLDFQDRLWNPLRRFKKKLPRTIYLIGNHEHRISRAIELSPELEGAISIDDLNLREWYDQVVPYEGGTPGTVEIDGIHYAHYFVSGVMGRPISGEHPAHALITKRFVSSTCGHVHTSDFCVRTNGDGRKVMGAVAGVFQDYDSDWAGGCNDLWWRGVLFKENVENGVYDARWISLNSIRKAYG
jgi:hypothetical protein